MMKGICSKFSPNPWLIDRRCSSKLFNEREPRVLVKETLKHFSKRSSVNKNREVPFKFTAFLLFLAISLSGIAQERALGLRLGWGGGLSYVQSITDDQDFEIILTPRWSGLILTGLYERKVPLSSESWHWYYGGGLHGGYHHRSNFVGEGFNGDQQYINLGFDLIAGIKYR